MAAKKFRMADALRMVQDAGFDWDTGDWAPLRYYMKPKKNGLIYVSGDSEQAPNYSVWFYVDSDGVVTTDTHEIYGRIEEMLGRIKALGVKSHRLAEVAPTTFPEPLAEADPDEYMRPTR